MSFTYEYPRPSVTVDIIVLLKNEAKTEVLLIQRKFEPFKNCWALPGGFVDEEEAPLMAALRELEEETSLTGIDLTPCGFFGEPDRDPRGHTISLCFKGITTAESKARATAQDDAKELAWFDLEELPSLAFDHLSILRETL